MNDPDPNKPGWHPTASTYATAIGGAAAAVILGTINAFFPHVHFGDGYAAALATVCGAVAGYFFAGGRR